MPKRRRSGKSAGGPVGDPAGFLAPRALRLGHNFDDECDAVEGASPAYRALAALVGRPVFGEYEEEDADACGRRPGRSLTRARHRAGPFLWVNRTIASGRRWEPMPSVSRSRIALSFLLDPGASWGAAQDREDQVPRMRISALFAFTLLTGPALAADFREGR